VKFLLSKNERIAGLLIVAVAALSIFYVTALIIHKKYFYAKKIYYTKINNGDGLRSGADIMLSGIRIGEVGGLVIEGDNSIKVELRVFGEYANRISDSCKVVVQRQYGIGEKKLSIAGNGKCTTVLPENSFLPVDEKKDIIEKISELDLDKLISTLDKTSSVLDRMLNQLEKENRIEKLGIVLDEMAILLVNLNQFMRNNQNSATRLINNPQLPQLISSLHRISKNPELEKLLTDGKLYELIANLNKIAGQPDLPEAVSGVKKFFNNSSLYLLLDGGAKMAQTEQFKTLSSDLSELLKSLNAISPQIPRITEEFSQTLKEFTIVLKALQSTWLLDDQAKEVIEKMKKKP